LNKNLRILVCENNNLIYLPQLNEKLKVLWCSNNNLTSLPDLNENLKYINCSSNNLTSLPHLNEKIEKINCKKNGLVYLPILNERIETFSFDENPISEIVNGENISVIKMQIQTINNFRDLYYSLKFKNQFKYWFWEKVMEPKIMKKYHPSYLLENLHEDTDLDELLDNW
jgi:hypothetical protein